MNPNRVRMNPRTMLNLTTLQVEVIIYTSLLLQCTTPTVEVTVLVAQQNTTPQRATTQQPIKMQKGTTRLPVATRAATTPVPKSTVQLTIVQTGTAHMGAPKSTTQLSKMSMTLVSLKVPLITIPVRNHQKWITTRTLTAYTTHPQ